MMNVHPHAWPLVSAECCRFGQSCWKPLCPFAHPHPGARARRLQRLWALAAADNGTEATDGDDDNDEDVFWPLVMMTIMTMTMTMMMMMMMMATFLFSSGRW